MKLSEKWLREWVQPEATTQELVDQLTLAGLEVDGVEPVASEFSGVVVGEVIKREQHPDADKLSVCEVSDGQETFQVVCGAANVRVGLKIPFAKIGAVLPGNFKIKKAKLRGVESFGMLCAESELGLAESSDGLMELSPTAPHGVDIREYLELDDHIIDVDLTPNRADCLSVAGIARETGLLFKQDLTAPSVDAVVSSADSTPAISIAAPEACPRYLGRCINGVDVSAETPIWMVEKLRRSGVRSIDVVVDVTNFVLLELGQPMHAFDQQQIKGGIQVRMASDGEKLTLLDGQEIELTSDTLVIADEERALALAGVMGGQNSGVSTETQNLILEAAFFNPIIIAGKARNYGLHTDSSHRFERGVDPELPRQAMERATQLILELCGGEAGPVVEVVNEEYLPRPAKIQLRKSRIETILGLTFEDAEVTDILERLGMQVTTTSDGWEAIAPTYRFDMAIEADLIEELARIYGYNRLPTRTPAASTPLAKLPESKMAMRDLRRQIIARGYQEAITYSFVEPQLQATLDPDNEALALINPISADMAVMRTNLWPGLINAASYNLKRQQPRVRLFETGLRFVLNGDQLAQVPTLGLLITGPRDTVSWTTDEQSVDFFDLKGDLEALFARTGQGDRFGFVRGDHPSLHPGQSAHILFDRKVIGNIGALHPQVQKQLGIKQPIILAQVDLDVVRDLLIPAFEDISKFPEMRRDLALVVDQHIAVDAVFDTIRAAAGEYLVKLKLFDVYSGKGIDPERKSLALGLTWQHPSRTLTDEEVNNAVQAVIDHCNDSIGATLRG